VVNHVVAWETFTFFVMCTQEMMMPTTETRLYFQREGEKKHTSYQQIIWMMVNTKYVRVYIKPIQP
jgi:hypothetical protein